MRRAASILICVAIIACALSLSGCNADTEGVVFGTYYSLEYRGSLSYKERKAVKELLPSLEAEVSSSYESSPIYMLNSGNAGHTATVSEDAARIYELSMDAYRKTNGAFNPATFPITELWKFSPDAYIGAADSIPDEHSIAELLPLCNPELFTYDPAARTITKSANGAKLDFGGIAKGYAADKTFDTLIGYGAKDIVVDIGGTFKVSSPVKIHVANPRGGNYVAAITIENTAVATSGDYQRYYVVDGVRYHHITDKTGHPAGLNDSNAPISVTIVGESAAICDALSTAVMVMGYSDACPLLNTLGYSALILTEDGYYTIGDTYFEILDQRQKLN